MHPPSQRKFPKLRQPSLRKPNAKQGAQTRAAGAVVDAAGGEEADRKQAGRSRRVKRRLNKVHRVMLPLLRLRLRLPRRVLPKAA